jgi:hypothetical protein
MAGIDFYKNLQALQLPITQIFHQQYFSDVPGNWFIIIADVKNSTEAVNAGKHNDVNLVAAGSLIAALNIAKKYKAEIPFFFGGDGGTILVPEELLKDVLNALAAHNENVKNNFELEMYVGYMSIEEILQTGQYIKIAKQQIGANFQKAVIIGGGLQYAEQQIKNFSEGDSTKEDDIELDLTGLECRWDKIKPPSDENEIVCYLVEATKPDNQLKVYGDVMQQIENIYGDIKQRNPLSIDRLKLLLSVDKIRKEMLVKYGKWKLRYFIDSFAETLLGRYYFRYNWQMKDIKGQEYIKQIISQADTLTIDGRINTIITGRKDKRLRLITYLSDQEKAGNLIYGHHISNESIMTCYIENRNTKHIHFVDGSDGGYTEAAKEFKTKLKPTEKLSSIS